MKINESTVIVTGGASGLGEATVRHFLQNKANVSIFDFDEKRGEQMALELGDRVIFCKTDVSCGSSVKESFDKTLEKFGAVNIVVNCAGIATPGKVIGRNGPIAIDQFTKVININLIGTMNVIRFAAEKMMKNIPNEDGEKGVIINTASVAAFEGQIGQAAYAASKAGVVGMTLPIAREFADYGIRVVTIAPGLFETPMLAGLPEKAKASLIQIIPFPKRLGKPIEFAFLAQHIVENPLINGETIRLDCSIRMPPK